ncbi:MAG: Nitroreductase [Promethearchaeota archaeon]|nr:MAG: Nitroreductase [Candidatus Lokiarchaeota archaeon]
MSIKGIDYDKCSTCKQCLITCTLFRYDKENQRVFFQDSDDFCNLCGHCIARCPEDAILYDNLGKPYEFENLNTPEKIVSYEDLLKFFKAHRSIRRYRRKKVPKKTLEKVFEAMNYAPTAANARTEKFSIISDNDKLKEVNDAVINELMKDEGMKRKYGTLFKLLSKAFHYPIFFDAPHVIFVTSPFNHEQEANNIGIIITYGRLAAESLGLGTCWNGWTQIAMNRNPDIRKLANLKGKRVGLFTIGYPSVKFHRTAPRKIKKPEGF